MGLMNEYGESELMCEQEVATKISLADKNIETLIDLIPRAHPLLEKYVECEEGLPAMAALFELYSFFCTEIPFTVTNKEVKAYFEYFKPRAEKIEPHFHDETDNLTAYCHMILPGVLVQKGYNDGTSVFDIDAGVYNYGHETLCASLFANPAKPITFNIFIDEITDGFEDCVGCIFKVYGGAEYDSFGEECMNCEFHHPYESALKQIRHEVGPGCSFYLLNPDGTSKRVG